MANRLSNIVTKTGDQGVTGLADGSRCSKSDLRIHCLGEIDELNVHIGLIKSQTTLKDSAEIVTQIQHDLFDLGAELSQVDKTILNQQYVDYLEQHAIKMNDTLPPLKEFILPGGSILVGSIHLTRTIARRAERNLIALDQNQSLNKFSLMYLNRLSDLLFILARYTARETKVQEIYWNSKISRSTTNH